MVVFTLQELGWQTHFEQQVSAEQTRTLIHARVCAHFGSQVVFLTERGEITVPASIVQLKAFDLHANIAVGDWLLLDPQDYRAEFWLQRKTMLARKAAGEKVKPQIIAANFDSAFIVSSCNQEFNLSRLERYLALVLESEATPVVVLTKADLCDNPGELRRAAEKLHPGLIVETLDARDENQTAVLEDWCGNGKTICLLGSSGVGKSTLANALGGHDIQTQGIREQDAKGRHTTTTRSMHRLKAGGWLIDNPGMRELQLPACESGLNELFDDVVQLATQCRFRNCSHRGDAGCALEAAVAAGDLEQRRLVNYLKLLSEQARNATSLAERREQERKTGQFYKSVIQEKKNRRNQ